MLGKRDLDRAFMREEGGRRLEPDQRRAQRRPLHLRDVIGVVQADGDELARDDWNVDLQIAEGDDFAREIEGKPEWLREQMHLLGADFAVDDFAVSLKSAEGTHRIGEVHADARGKSRFKERRFEIAALEG